MKYNLSAYFYSKLPESKWKVDSIHPPDFNFSGWNDNIVIFPISCGAFKYFLSHIVNLEDHVLDLPEKYRLKWGDTYF